MVHSSAFWMLSTFEILISCVALYFMRRNRLVREYRYVAALLAARVLNFAVSAPLFPLAHRHILNGHLAYQIYFFSYWIGFALQSVLWLMIIYSMYKLAMAPLKGLQSLGMLVFRWAAAVSAAVTIAMAFAPHANKITIMVAAITQLTQTASVLTLCLLLFVTFAVRPMGLSYRSRIFGVSLGMGIVATGSLVSAAWLNGRQHMMDTLDIFNALVCLSVALVWTSYFALPEPERHIIVLPTTSPFLRWNQISLALGSNPGFVAVGNVAPSAFAGAELEVMRRASVKVPEIKRDMSIAV